MGCRYAKPYSVKKLLVAKLVDLIDYCATTTSTQQISLAL